MRRVWPLGELDALFFLSCNPARVPDGSFDWTCDSGALRPISWAERQHGFRHGLDERRSISPAAERTIHRGIHAEHAAFACRSKRLSWSGPARIAGKRGAGRRVARPLQVLRWRANMAEHTVTRIYSGSNERTEWVAFADPRIPSGGGSYGTSGRQWTLLL